MEVNIINLVLLFVERLDRLYEEAGGRDEVVRLNCRIPLKNMAQNLKHVTKSFVGRDPYRLCRIDLGLVHLSEPAQDILEAAHILGEGDDVLLLNSVALRAALGAYAGEGEGAAVDVGKQGHPRVGGRREVPRVDYLVEGRRVPTCCHQMCW